MLEKVHRDNFKAVLDITCEGLLMSGHNRKGSKVRRWKWRPKSINTYKHMWCQKRWPEDNHGKGMKGNSDAAKKGKER